MKSLFFKFGTNIKNIFFSRNLIWHLLAILSTYLIVLSGFDWTYSRFFERGLVFSILFSSAPIGALVPIAAPLIILLIGKLRKNQQLLNTGFALGQAAIVGSLISSLYKAFTGRAHPDPFLSLATDVTHIFKFGFMRGGIFWGWPSSHTTIAFAMAITLWMLYPKNKLIKSIALLYALFIGIGVSVTIHWFSDFTAGAIIGTVIGVVVGKAFRERIFK